MTTIRMGYLGYATVDGVGYFLTGSSMNAIQTVNAPNLVAGSYVHTGFNYDKVNVGGNFSGPLHENAGNLSDMALMRTSEGDHMTYDDITVGIAFFGEGTPSGKRFTGCCINSLTITATAGDVINFIVDFVGKYPPSNFSSVYEGIDCAKLLTWDRMAVGFDRSDPVQTFTMTINNNLERQFNIEANPGGNLFPVDITAGIREITGTISMYAIQAMPNFGADSYPDYSASTLMSVNVAIDGLMSLNIPSMMHRPEGSATPGVAIYTLNFTSVCQENI